MFSLDSATQSTQIVVLWCYADLFWDWYQDQWFANSWCQSGSMRSFLPALFWGLHHFVEALERCTSCTHGSANQDANYGDSRTSFGHAPIKWRSYSALVDPVASTVVWLATKQQPGTFQALQSTNRITTKKTSLLLLGNHCHRYSMLRAAKLSTD